MEKYKHDLTTSGDFLYYNQVTLTIDYGKALGETFGELGQVLFHILLVCPLPKVDFPRHRLFFEEENTVIHKYDVVVTEAHRSISDSMLVTKKSRVLSILVGKSTICSHPMSSKVFKKRWLLELDICAQRWRLSGRFGSFDLHQSRGCGPCIVRACRSVTAVHIS